VGDEDVSDDDDVFKALADPGRRRLLDALFESDGRTLASLCEVLPTMTRFGVMKHLAVLEAAHLVVTHKVGRTKLHYLNAVPITEIHDRWISKYAQPTADAMVGLRRHLENP
jgi:DNA-binding transcriptional ArsR family regulator